MIQVKVLVTGPKHRYVSSVAPEKAQGMMGQYI